MSGVKEKVEQLLTEAPDLFDLEKLDESIFDEYVIVSTDLDNGYLDETSAHNNDDGPWQSDTNEISIKETLQFPKNWGGALSKLGFPPPPDALGFYIPFHYLPNCWGIYLVVRNLEILARFVFERCPNATMMQAKKAAMLFVYYHEAYHHKIEMLATRMELLSRKPCYKLDVETIYKAGIASDNCIEETAANVHGLMKTRELLDKKYKYAVIVRRELDEALIEYIRGMIPKSYHSAAEYFLPLKNRISVVSEWQTVEHAFFDQIQHSHFGGERWNSSVWDFGSFLDYPDNKVNGRVNYLYPLRGMPIPLGGRLLSTRQVVKKIEKVLGEKLIFVRSTKGSHKLYKTKTGREAVIPLDTNMPIGTLKSILQSLGLNMSVHQLLRG